MTMQIPSGRPLEQPQSALEKHAKQYTKSSVVFKKTIEQQEQKGVLNKIGGKSSLIPIANGQFVKEKDLIKYLGFTKSEVKDVKNQVNNSAKMKLAQDLYANKINSFVSQYQQKLQNLDVNEFVKLIRKTEENNLSPLALVEEAYLKSKGSGLVKPVNLAVALIILRHETMSDLEWKALIRNDLEAGLASRRDVSSIQDMKDQPDRSFHNTPITQDLIPYLSKYNELYSSVSNNFFREILAHKDHVQLVTWVEAHFHAVKNTNTLVQTIRDYPDRGAASELLLNSLEYLKKQTPINPDRLCAFLTVALPYARMINEGELEEKAMDLYLGQRDQTANPFATRVAMIQSLDVLGLDTTMALANLKDYIKEMINENKSIDELNKLLSPLKDDPRFKTFVADATVRINDHFGRQGRPL